MDILNNNYQLVKNIRGGFYITGINDNIRSSNDVVLFDFCCEDSFIAKILKFEYIDYIQSIEAYRYMIQEMNK